MYNIVSSLPTLAQGWSSTPPSDQIPLVPVTNDHAPSSDPTTPQSTFLSWSLTKAVAMACSSAQSSSVQLEAEDTVLGVKNQKLGKSIRQYNPEGLSLFDVVLLTHIVHKLAPTYALFDSQCYWFANVIFEVITKMFPSRSQTTPPPGPPPRIFLPNDYLPKEAGRWLGVLINDSRVVEAVITIAKSNFERKQE
jgi:hypothetical protein